VNRRELITADPLLVFLAGAFVGIVIGPKAVEIGKELVEAKAAELANTMVERFMASLREVGDETVAGSAQGRV
jgi:hypothetical protein